MKQITVHLEKFQESLDFSRLREQMNSFKLIIYINFDLFVQLEKRVLAQGQWHPGWNNGPLSTKLEKKMWLFLKDFLTNSLNNFASTIEVCILKITELYKFM